MSIHVADTYDDVQYLVWYCEQQATFFVVSTLPWESLFGTTSAKTH